ncbi:MAG: TonB-dependent receptor [Bacteroidales bacterium]|jgi:hypothetical protein
MNRKTILLMMILILSLFPGKLLAQQEDVFLKKVGIDSLMTFLKKDFSLKIYYIKDTSDIVKYSVKAPKDEFLKEAFRELKVNGYTVTEYEGAFYILKDFGFSTKLPTAYFEKQDSLDLNSDFLNYLNTKNTVVTFQNKIYEIGDISSEKSGKAYVSGYVRDVLTGEPLTGVSVFEEKAKIYAQTDAYGFYKIMLSIGANKLCFTGYSLEDANLNLIVYDNGGLDVAMKEKVFSLTGAVISSESTANHRSNKIGIEKVRINRIKHIPAVFGEADVIKVVLTLPGVKSVGEASSGFNVRGGSTDQNLILFNDGTIYNPSHLFGMFSAFNSDVISDIELYKSSIPTEFGGRISSVLEVRGREGNSKKVSGSLGLGLLTSRFHVEGPILQDKTTFIIGGRTTYSDWILGLLPENSGYSNGTASFHDLNVSISHKIDVKNSIYAYGYYSHDGFSFSNDTTFRYGNLNGSIKWRSNFSEKHSMVVSVGYDKYGYTVDDSYNPATAYSLSSTIKQGFLKLNFKSVLNEKHTFSYGVNSVYYYLKPGMYHPLGEESLVLPKDLKTETALESAAFLSDSWQITDKLSFDFGLRYSYYLALNPTKHYGGPEYRISGKYSFSDKFSIKAGFNSMRQYIHMISNTTSISPTDTWKLSDEGIKPQEGWQAASGIYWTFANNRYDLSVEGYYKSMYHYPDYKSGAILSMNENLSEDLIETRGKAYGIEFMLKKPLGKLNGWISYTYSRTLLKEMEDRGVYTINGGDWYPASHDKPHDLKFVGNFQFTHRYSISLNLDYSTGRPVTIPVSKYYYAGGYRLFYSDRNAYRIPDYFRMDLALNVEPGHYLKQLTHMSFTLGVYNVTGRKNAYSIYYTTNEGRKIEGHMLSVFATQIPYINLNLKF